MLNSQINFTKHELGGLAGLRFAYNTVKYRDITLQ
jgi:hypothetical protein